MKFLIVFAIIAAVNALPFTEEQKKKGEEHAMKCVGETGADPENIKKIRSGDFSANDEKTQCFTKCFFEKAGFMDADGKLQEDVIVAKFSVDKPKEKVQALYNLCKDQKGASNCETAYKVYKCYRQAVEF